MFNDKRVLIYGVARSGIAAAKVLCAKGAQVTMTDSKDEESLYDIIQSLKAYPINFVLGQSTLNLDGFDLAVISPGIPLDNALVQAIQKAGIKLIGEIELAFLLSKGTFIGITGTNGKTTTTALTGKIFENAKIPSCVVGNIGTPAVSMAQEAIPDMTYITELSSFQLETIDTFKVHIAAVLNITPDHLNRHKTMAQYIAAKARVFENQTQNDFLVLNMEDETVKSLAKNAKSRVYYFSNKQVLPEGAFLVNEMICTKINGDETQYIKVSQLKILGDHNIQNVLAAVLIARLAGVDKKAIVKTLSEFAGVEHRIEYVGTIDKRKFYNDSKATNPDSTICAIAAMVDKTHLIAGGMDKKSDFTEMFQTFGTKIKSLIVFGETKEKLASDAVVNGFETVYMVSTLEEAVEKAFQISSENEAILLSPACASWDMYKDYEERGRHFKECFERLKESRG